MKIVIAVAAALAALLAAAANAAAQGYPGRPITLVVGFAPGGGTDTVARVMQRKLGEFLGQTIVVENRAGAGGIIAADLVSKAAPDGYTILLATIAALAVAPHLNSKLPYNPLRDFAPISMATVSGNVLVVHPSLPAKTIAEYVKEANTRPGGLPYGTSGVGSAGNLEIGRASCRERVGSSVEDGSMKNKSTFPVGGRVWSKVAGETAMSHRHDGISLLSTIRS